MFKPTPLTELDRKLLEFAMSDTTAECPVIHKAKIK